MIRETLDWLGFGTLGHSTVAGGHDHAHQEGHGHTHGAGAGHGHVHGVIDPTITTTEKGIRAIKWSFAILAITAVAQFAVVLLSGSVALLADTIHNVGDASTAIPLWIAFWFARRKPNQTFTYGYGKVEDIAGVAVVLIILFSAIVAGYETIDRLVHPHAISMLGAVAAAGITGFLGNEVVAVFRIRVGRDIHSAALIADGYHARVDGLTSLAVVLGAIGVWLGYPLADPIVGLVITIMIFGIVWQSARAVFTRLLDGVEPGVTAELRHAIEDVPGIRGIDNIQTRWIGHRLYAQVDINVDDNMPVRDARALADRLRSSAMAHLPALASLRVSFAAAATRVDPAPARQATGPGYNPGRC
jgi:cation diffusion facilitator family transporter